MKTSAGILLYRFNKKKLEIFLVHPGGPFWKNKDEGAWSIPKGEYEEDEDALQAAIREFKEETGVSVSGDFIPLNTVKLKSGKYVKAWALEKDIDSTAVKSNTFLLEWPPKSGKKIEVPEVDRAEWFSIQVAKEKINQGQLPLLNELSARVS
ncbi:MAG: NUDIX domain-containing protein [Chitinophagales bacterium]